MRSVRDNLLGREKYLLNPFCSSNMEMQRRIEDQLVLFFRKVINRKVKAGEIKGEAVFHDQVKKSTTNALKEPISFDFRSLMDHINCYRKSYAASKEDEVTVQMSCEFLKNMVLELAHKHRPSATQVHNWKRKGSRQWKAR